MRKLTIYGKSPEYQRWKKLKEFPTDEIILIDGKVLPMGLESYNILSAEAKELVGVEWPQILLTGEIQSIEHPLYMLPKYDEAELPPHLQGYQDRLVDDGVVSNLIGDTND